MGICKHCWGKGYVEREDENGYIWEVTCPVCGGSGRSMEQED